MAKKWSNGVYWGFLREFDSGFPVGGGKWSLISIVAHDETARHDWREYQQLKNFLVGPEWEAIELYPSESRLVDPSNCFYLYCVPPGVIPWGRPMGTRSVLHPRDTIAPQRAFGAEEVNDENHD